MGEKMANNIWICNDCNLQFICNERREDPTTENGRCPYCLSKNIEVVN
jgi:DNA-directed RNA polymerase subunit RPC12/RpoP